MPLPKQAWGNPVGWTLAGFLLAGIAAGLFFLHQQGSPTPATGFSTDSRLAQIQMPIPPVMALRAEPPAEGDAGDIYLGAARSYLLSLPARRPYDDFLTRPPRGPAGPGELPLLQNLRQATHHRTATLFAANPEVLIHYNRSLPELDALYALGRVAIRQAGLLATRNEPGDRDQARALYEAALMLGVRLYEERIIHRQLELGYRLMSDALGGLVALARLQEESMRAIRLGEMRNQLTQYVNTQIQPVWERIGAIDDVTRADDAADRHAGDVRAIALSEQVDVLWRTEAILQLGKARLAAARPADRRAAQRTLEHLQRTTANPRLSQAVGEALALTDPERRIAR